jgi:predicted nucleic acid-binding protein
MFLVDTNVISEVRKPDGHEGVKAWAAQVPGHELCLSVLVVAEIRCGIERKRRKDPRQADTFEKWLTGLIAQFAERIIDIDVEVAQEYGRMTAARPLPVIDALMAATAKVHGMTLVTRNTKDIEGTGATLLNPWDRSP